VTAYKQSMEEEIGNHYVHVIETQYAHFNSQIFSILILSSFLLTHKFYTIRYFLFISAEFAKNLLINFHT